MSSNEQLPDLLRVGQVTDMLDVSRSQLQNLFPQLHILNLTRGNRRFPTPYITQLRDYLARKREWTRILPVTEFAVTDLARTAIAQAEEQLELTIADHANEGYITAPDVARILNLGRMSVNNWVERGELSAVYEARGQRNMHISVGSLQALYSWQHPQVMRDEYPQET